MKIHKKIKKNREQLALTRKGLGELLGYKGKIAYDIVYQLEEIENYSIGKKTANKLSNFFGGDWREWLK